MSTVAELLEEFTAITEFISSGEKPTASDRQNAIALWGKFVEKLTTGPMLFTARFEAHKHGEFLLAETDEKSQLWKINRDIEKTMEESDPGAIEKYMGAKSAIERCNLCIAFLERWLSETEPDRNTIVQMDHLAVKAVFADLAATGNVTIDESPKKPRTKRSKEGSDHLSPAETAPAGENNDEQGAEPDGSEDQGISEEQAKEPYTGAVDEAPVNAAEKSSFQKTLEMARNS